MNMEERSDASPLSLLVGTTDEAHTSSFSFPSTDSHHRFSPPTFTNPRATAQPTDRTETVHQPPVPGMIYPPYMNYPNVPYVPLPTMPTMMPARVHLNSFSSSVSQPNSSRLRVLAPKAPQDSINSAAKESNTVQQPDFIETIRLIRQQLFQKARLKESDEPLNVEPRVYTEWRKSVSEAWKPVSHFPLSFPLI